MDVKETLELTYSTVETRRVIANLFWYSADSFGIGSCLDSFGYLSMQWKCHHDFFKYDHLWPMSLEIIHS